MSHASHRSSASASAILAAAALPALLLTAAFARQAPSATQQKVDFARDVQPILKAHCVQCHGAARHEAGLRLDARADALRGGVSGRAFLPGNASASLLIQRVRGMGGKPRMPLGFAPLPDAQVATLCAWIDQGAKWPEGTAPGKHWAYVRPVRPALPKVSAADAKWCRNPIDYFVVARLEKEGLKPSPPAPREILLRRVYLDLIGLPPSPREVDAFLADHSPSAYEKVVDRLLASPAYGERWARPWLDLARYADTNGYEKDERRSMWPYRDWVIAAFNRDMPFDQFTIKQLAGDLLPNATLEDRIATGFHRNTMKNEEGGVDQQEARWLTDVDRVGTTGSVWLGTTTACTQCHDHKYDPFTQKEFYRLMAFFEHADERTVDVATPEQEAKLKALREQVSAAEAAVKAAAKDRAAERTAGAKLADLKKQLAAETPPTTLVFAEKADGAPPTAYVRVKGAYLSKADKVEAGVPAVLNPWPASAPLNRLGLAEWIVSPANPLTARVTVNRFWEALFGRGIVETVEDFGTQGAPPTHPKLLDWLAVEFETPNPPTPFPHSLATLAGKGEPVRTVWSVPPSLAERGTSGAARGRGEGQGVRYAMGWSMKKLLRLIVTSATYRQSSRVTPELAEKDPANRLLARGPRFRMEAEMIRDSALEAAGLLSHKLGGPSVFPSQPEGIWNMPYNGDKWVTSKGEDRYRRGLYTFWRRTSPYPEFETFDATSREYCTVRRIRTDTPLQALTTLNDPAFMDAARGLAGRMMREGGAAVPAQIVYAFRCCTARRPTAVELKRLVALYQKELARYQTDPKAAQALAAPPPDAPAAHEAAPPAPNSGGAFAQRAALTVVANVLLNLDETLTKE